MRLDNIKQEDFKIQMRFVLTCLGRVKELYQKFNAEVASDEADYSAKFRLGETKINALYLEMLDILFSDPNKKLVIRADDFYSLAPSYEEYSTVDAAVAVQVALMCSSIIEFHEDKDLESITEVLMNMEEIINILKSREYDQQVSESSIEKIERDDYIDFAIDQEEAHEQNIISFLKADQTRESFESIVEETKIR
jgi:hypothetical protein